MKKYRVTKEHPFLKEGTEFEQNDLLPESLKFRTELYHVHTLVLMYPTWFEEVGEPVELPKEKIKGNYQICEHINLKEWDSKILEVLKNTKICPLCQPKEECQEEHCCMCHECENTRPMTPGEAEIAKGLDEAFPEPKEKSLSEIIKILEDLKREMAGEEYVSVTNGHRESFNLGIETCLVKLEKVILKLKNL